MTDAGHWSDVLADVDRAPLTVSAPHEVLAAEVVLAAALAGDDQRLENLRSDWATFFDADHLGPIIDLYLQARKGTHFVHADYKALAQITDKVHYTAFCLSALADQATDSTEVRIELLHMMFRSPGDRLTWILTDRYFRHAPHVTGDQFYGSLVWLYPHDPWVQHAAADAAKRRSTTAPSADVYGKKLLDAQRSLLDKMEKSAAVTPLKTNDINKALYRVLDPFDLAASVHSLLLSNDKDGAITLARRYHSLLLHYPSNNLRVWAKRLVRLSES